MDIEKTMQFMLDSQARHESAIAEMDIKLNRTADHLETLSAMLVALAAQQKEQSLGLSALSEAFVRQMSQTSALFQETDRRIAERGAETDRRIQELAATVAQSVRNSNHPNAQ